MLVSPSPPSHAEASLIDLFPVRSRTETRLVLAVLESCSSSVFLANKFLSFLQPGVSANPCQLRFQSVAGIRSSLTPPCPRTCLSPSHLCTNHPAGFPVCEFARAAVRKAPQMGGFTALEARSLELRGQPCASFASVTVWSPRCGRWPGSEAPASASLSQGRLPLGVPLASQSRLLACLWTHFFPKDTLVTSS